MCYSVYSSLKTTTISLFAIIYLLSSNIPYFQWIGTALIGWCLMQFAEMLLWMTDPSKECTIWNKIIKFTIIPLTLILQPLSGLWGSLYVIPWNKSTEMRKYFMIFYSISIVFAMLWVFFYKTDKTCAIVTEEGHLYWHAPKNINSPLFTFYYYLWLVLIALPMIIFWNKSYLLLILLTFIPLIGFYQGLKTDSRASVWCHYTSFTSIIGSIALFLQQQGIYKFV